MIQPSAPPPPFAPPPPSTGSADLPTTAVRPRTAAIRTPLLAAPLLATVLLASACGHGSGAAGTSRPAGAGPERSLPSHRTSEAPAPEEAVSSPTPTAESGADGGPVRGAAGTAASDGLGEARGEGPGEVPQEDDGETSEISGGGGEAAVDGGKTSADGGAARAWLRDDQGREFRLEPLPKGPVHRRMEDGRLLTRWGVLVEVEREDEEFYYFRVYRRPEGARGPGRPTPSPLGGAGSAAKPAGWDELPVRGDLPLVEASAGLPRGAQWRNGFRLTDLDGDGWLDLALPPARKRFGGPLLLLGTGDGWQPWEGARFVPAEGGRLLWDYGDVEAVDLDGDGRTDLAFAMHLQGLAAFVQREGGTFASWSEGLELGRRADGSLPFSSRALRALDLDGDGRRSLVVLGEGPRLATERRGAAGPGSEAGGKAGALEAGAFGLQVFEATPEGRWRQADRLPGSAPLFGQGLAVGDADGDGRVDLLATSDAAAPGGLLVLARDGEPEVVEIPLPPGFRVAAGTIGSLHEGGEPRLAVVSTGYAGGAWSTLVEIRSWTPARGWHGEPVVEAPGAFRVTAVHLADLDGDGSAELVLGTGEGRLVVLRGTAGGGWERDAADPLPAAPGCRVFHIESGLDRDGSRLLVANRAGEEKGGMFGPAVAGCPGDGSVHAWRLPAPAEG